MKDWSQLDLYLLENYIEDEFISYNCIKASNVKNSRKPTSRRKATQEDNGVVCNSIDAILSEPFELSDETFQEKLFSIIDNRNLKDSEVYKKSYIDKRLFSKIRSDIDYHPSKNTVIQLVFGLELDLEEGLDLLKTAGYFLSFSVKSDVIVRYFLMNGNYNLMELNEALYDHDLQILFK